MERLSFALKLVICFFLFDAVEKAGGVAGLLIGGYPLLDARVFVDHYFPLFLGLGFDLLLAAQLFRRTRTGRFWGMIYLAAVTILGLFLLVVEPGRWVELGRLGRVREVLTVAINLAFLGILAGRRSAEILTR